MASLLGNLVYAGQLTLLTTQPNLGAVNAAANLYSINTGVVAGSLHVAHFTPAFLSGQAIGGLGAGVGFGGCTLPALLWTRSGATMVWYNPNTTALPGEVTGQFFHSRIR